MAGYIASEFERFTAVCLGRQTPEQIAEARLIFYAGVLAAVDAWNKAMLSDDPMTLLQNMESILDECAVFKKEVSLKAKAKSKTKGKK